MKTTFALLCVTTGVLVSSTAIAEDSGNRFFEPFRHYHFSPKGTPYVHSFGIEPALTGRDLLVDYTYVSGDGFREHEAELELEWAFTRQLGIILELPYISEDPKGGAVEDGFGGLGLVPRAVIFENDKHVVTIQSEIELPTGSEAFGSETAIAPGIATWHDLGNWFTLGTQVAVEHGFDSDETELGFGFALTKSFGESVSHCSDSHCNDSHNHGGRLFNIHAEITGGTPTTGDDRGDVSVDGLIGISYGITESMDARLGYMVPLSAPNDYDYAVTGGLIFHF